MKIKSIVCSLLLCLSAALAHAQSTTVTGTIVDPTSTVWKGATISALFRPTPGIPGPYVWSGGAYNPQPAIITADSSGHFSISLPSNANIVPAGSQWIFTVCPDATFQCAIVTTAIGGGSMDISAAITANVSTTTVISLGIPKFYNPAEMKPPPLNQGMLGFNTTMLYYQVWDGTLWETICTVQNALCGGGGSGPTIEVNGTPTTSQTIINFVNAGGVTWTNPSAGIIEAAAAGGGSGCTLGGIPDFAVLYTPDATVCTGSSQFITDSQGNVEINGGTNGSGTLEINSAFDIDSDWLMDESNIFLVAKGANATMPGIDLSVDDSLYSGGSTQLLPMFIAGQVYRAGKDFLGMEIIPAVHTVTANLSQGIEVDSPSGNFGGTYNLVWNYYAGTSGQGNVANTEEIAYLVETNSIEPTVSTYCDFVARVHLGSIASARESLGCGADYTSTFNGPVIMNSTLTITGPGPNWAQTGTNLFSALPTCNGGQEGTIAPVTDSTTNTWGATVTGSGTDHIAAYCDGTNWTVYAK